MHNVRSAHNVGSLLRTADGLGIEKVYLSGYTPYPATVSDSRLPHLQQKISSQIHKTALGAEKMVSWQHISEPIKLLGERSKSGFLSVALEQTPKAKDLTKFKTNSDIVLIVGSEISGVEPGLLEVADRHLYIPMAGQKESFNVAIAASLALYHLRFIA
jgi:tRNA G18 (ribose-2'-O)-methylase SpoU